MTDYKNLKVYQKSQINGLTKHLSNIRFTVDYSPENRGRQNDKIIDRAKELGLDIDYNDSHLNGEKFTFQKPRKITKEQSDFGKAWLKEYFFKSDGKPRSGKRTEYVGDRVLAIAKSVSRFEFVGVLGVANQMWEIQQFLPIYRAYNRKGEYFDYSPVHWGQPVIMVG